jgi:hypothetical protein
MTLGCAWDVGESNEVDGSGEDIVVEADEVVTSDGGEDKE